MTIFSDGRLILWMLVRWINNGTGMNVLFNTTLCLLKMRRLKFLITDHVGDCKKYNLTECRISIVYSHFHVCHMSGKYEMD